MIRYNIISRKVNAVLRHSKVTKAPVDVLKLAQSQGAVVQFGPMPDELSGFLYRSGPNEKPIIGVNSLHSETRQRFTIAHELGHMLLHKDEVIIDRKFQVHFRDSRSSSANDIAEIEANFFASQILMPEKFVLQSLTEKAFDLGGEAFIEELAMEFNVSLTAMTYRLSKLGFVPPN